MARRFTLIRTLVADPPWRYDDGDQDRGARANYDDLSTPEICAALPRALDEAGARIAYPAHLYLWTTNAFIADAHLVAQRWGFTPKTIITWIKGRLALRDGAGRRYDSATVSAPRLGWEVSAELVQQIGRGHYFANSTEHVVFAVRGTLKTQQAGIPTAFIAPRPRVATSTTGRRGDAKAVHSSKPEIFGDLVERMSPGPYLELFARRSRPGWLAWGDETGAHDARFARRR